MARGRKLIFSTAGRKNWKRQEACHLKPASTDFSHLLQQGCKAPPAAPAPPAPLQTTPPPGDQGVKCLGHFSRKPSYKAMVIFCQLIGGRFNKNIPVRFLFPFVILKQEIRFCYAHKTDRILAPHKSSLSLIIGR